MHIELSKLTPTHLGLLQAPAPCAVTVMREWDRSALTRLGYFVVLPEQGVAWACTNSETLASWADAQGSMVLEQRSQGWMLQFSGAAERCIEPAHHQAQLRVGARYPQAANANFSFRVTLHRCFVTKTHLPLKRFS